MTSVRGGLAVVAALAVRVLPAVRGRVAALGRGALGRQRPGAALRLTTAVLPTVLPTVLTALDLTRGVPRGLLPLLLTVRQLGVMAAVLRLTTLLVMAPSHPDGDCCCHCPSFADGHSWPADGAAACWSGPQGFPRSGRRAAPRRGTRRRAGRPYRRARPDRTSCPAAGAHHRPRAARCLRALGAPRAPRPVHSASPGLLPMGDLVNRAHATGSPEPGATQHRT
ncbi:hypothetical protein ACFQV4_15690 [Streptomyces thermocarboxydus]